MGKSRVYQLANEINVTSALILELLYLLGVEVKSDLSTVDEGTANLVRERITQAIEDEKRRLSEQAVAEEPGPETLEQPAAPVAVEAAPEAEPEELQPAAEVTEQSSRSARSPPPRIGEDGR